MSNNTNIPISSNEYSLPKGGHWSTAFAASHIAVTVCLDAEADKDGWANTSHYVRNHGY